MSEQVAQALLQVYCAGTDYGLPLSWVTEVIAAPAVTPLPAQRGCIRGICLHQGQFLTVFSLAALCGQKQEEPLAVICRRDGQALALTVPQVGQLIPDGGPAGAVELGTGELPVAYVSRSDPPVLVLEPSALLSEGPR